MKKDRFSKIFSEAKHVFGEGTFGVKLWRFRNGKGSVEQQRELFSCAGFKKVSDEVWQKDGLSFEIK